jgi:hypothetical protein
MDGGRCDDGWGKVQSGDWEAAAANSQQPTSSRLGHPNPLVLLLLLLLFLSVFLSLLLSVFLLLFLFLSWTKKRVTGSSLPAPPPRVCSSIILPLLRPAAISTMTAVSIYQHCKASGTSWHSLRLARLITYAGALAIRPIPPSDCCAVLYCALPYAPHDAPQHKVPSSGTSPALVGAYAKPIFAWLCPITIIISLMLHKKVCLIKKSFTTTTQPVDHVA